MSGFADYEFKRKWRKEGESERRVVDFHYLKVVG